MSRRDEYNQDWRAVDYTRPYRRPLTRGQETAARLAFGIAGALVLGALAVAMLYAPELRAWLAWH